MLTHIFSWSVLIMFIIWGIYTLRVIKREKTHFKHLSKTFHLLHYRLFIPPWWGVTLNDPLLPAVRFERTDTRYDWYAYFTWKKNPEQKSLKDLAEKWLEQENILIDPDRKLMEEKSHDHIEEYFRVEGTATQNECDRIYYDLCLIKDKRFPDFLFAESKSSVLNGLVEGPYFEEVLKHLESLD